uniref:Coagulation factor V n=1 Tax=Neogobius melanostomus TaxID=47308 RepID=A0A8C6TZK8_9GOBI
MIILLFIFCIFPLSLLRLGQTYKKVVFREYEEGFRQAKAHPPWLGLMGPTLRAEEGETLVVTFRNMAKGEYSLHPHGIAYGKQSEGAYYFDNTSQKEKMDDIVKPNGEHVYYWEVTSEVSPQKNDPSCLTHSYISHRNVVEDYNSGLIGALLVCKPRTLDASGQQIGIHHELVFLFGVFDEKESKYMPKNYAADDHIKYTINGYSNGTLPSKCKHLCHTSVNLHLLGMSSEPEVFSVHMNGQVLEQDGHKVSSVGLISGSSATVSMVAVHPGRWLLSSHTIKHMEVGLHGFVDVKECEGFNAPKRTLTVAQRRQSREWIYYIAAEEIIWDYAPNMPEHTDKDFKSQYLKNSAVRIGQKYKKAVFTVYKNESFTEKAETKQRRNELGILGPVIRAQIRDVIKVSIVFKNMASRPYSIYPHGLTIEKSQEGVNYPAGGNQSHGVLPGETHTYLWHVVQEDEPLDADSRCLTRMYYSAVDTPRDIASGLIGPLLICKSQSLNVRNVQLKADKEQHAVFSVFDENKSWYLQENVNKNCDRSQVNMTDPDFYKSNVMHTINGYTFESGTELGFCNGEVATWHVSSIGSQDFIQTATFYGHPFELNERTEDMLSLYPMTGETITMKMDNIGKMLEYEYVSYKDPYSGNEDMKHFSLDDATNYQLKIEDKDTKVYFIAAEEVEWDYAGYGREVRSQTSNRETKFKKVVFREYLDSAFTTPYIRGEIYEHLGILGPVIKAEVGQKIMVVFKNNASRPYSLHPNGYDNEVQPKTTFTYLWTITSTVGPLEGESDCRTWAYYSGVNPEKDIQSGLIGPLLVCREGTLNKSMTDAREFMLLFMTFDESQSWYFEENLEAIQKKTRRRSLSMTMKENLKFHTINGIIYCLKGLRMYSNDLVRWHLINLGSPNDFQSVHFHGQTFFHKKIKDYRQAIYPLLPGSFATLEMIPSKPGLWQLETEIGSIQQKGMQTLFLLAVTFGCTLLNITAKPQCAWSTTAANLMVKLKCTQLKYKNVDIITTTYKPLVTYSLYCIWCAQGCSVPLGMESRLIQDHQITASSTANSWYAGPWKPSYARLNKQGTINAWQALVNLIPNLAQ